MDFIFAEIIKYNPFVIYFTAFASLLILIRQSLCEDTTSESIVKLSLRLYGIENILKFNGDILDNLENDLDRNFDKRIKSLERRLVQINGALINMKKETGVVKNPNPTAVTTAE
jgi:hypothetical protein